MNDQTSGISNHPVSIFQLCPDKKEHGTACKKQQYLHREYGCIVSFKYLEKLFGSKRDFHVVSDYLFKNMVLKTLQ
jgi:hypothetical protein